MRRSYKEPYTHEMAVENMTAESGTHFDPLLIERLHANAARFRGIFSELVDSS